MLDLTKGYWPVPVAKEDMLPRRTDKKTAFLIPMGEIPILNPPFGLVEAPAIFQHLMNTILTGMRKFTAAYLDDVMIFSASREDNLNHLEKLLEGLKSAGLKVKLEKCQFGGENPNTWAMWLEKVSSLQKRQK